jgi:mycothiol synthase
VTAEGDGTAGAEVDAIVRRLTAGDLEALSPLVEAARAERAFAGSSDPSGHAIPWLASATPAHLAIATVADRLVGVLSPDVKAVYVEPALRRRGIGRRLVDEAVAIERERGHAEVLLGTVPDDAIALAFLRATGFAYHSTLWDMELPAEADVPPPVWPDGIVARNVDLPAELTAYIDVFNVAFADHATPMQMDASMWRAEDEAYWDAGDVAVLEEAGVTGRLIGFCTTDIGRRPGDDPRAEIWTVGVRPEARGRGLGRELIRWGVQRLRSVSPLPVTLSVNGRNEGALRLYEREGFRRTHTRDRWARPVV